MSSSAEDGPTRLLDRHDTLLLDLDGVVYTGPVSVPGAVDALVAAREHGTHLVYVTNNASRTPQQVADHLARLGLAATADDVVTSAEVAAEHLAQRLPVGAPVLVVGGEGLREAVARRGLRVVEQAVDRPAAVVQGFGPEVGWRQLAEAAYALADGVPWVATNRDLTVPTDRGLAPGNGTLVAALEATTGRRPVTVGKPEPGLFEAAVRRSDGRHPLAVGDRLDTDIAGARRCGIPTLLVLTGVSGVADLLAALPGERPDHVLADLSALTDPAGPARRLDGVAGWACGDWTARPAAGRLVLTGGGDPVDALRCAAAATWEAADAEAPLDVTAVVDLLAPRLAPRR